MDQDAAILTLDYQIINLAVENRVASQPVLLREVFVISRQVSKDSILIADPQHSAALSIARFPAYFLAVDVDTSWGSEFEG